MQIFNISEPTGYYGRKILEYRYDRTVKDLLGKWDLSLEGDLTEPYPFDLGQEITLPSITGTGIVTSLGRGGEGQIIISGNDNGFKLAKAIPEQSYLTAGTVDEAVSLMCSYCGVELVGSCGLNIPASGLVTGSTCAEAIQELAMMAGKITYIDNGGRLVIAAPSTVPPSFDTLLSKEEFRMDTDSYATGCTVIVQRRKKSQAEKTGGTKIVWRGETPSGSLDTVSYSGSDVFDDGDVTYEAEIYTPINAPKRTAYTIRDGDLTKNYVSEYTYDVESEIEVRGDREYRVFNWAMLTETVTSDITGSLSVDDGSVISVSEHSVKTTTRSYDLDGNLVSEVSESVTEKDSSVDTTGFISPAPPFDYRVTRKYETFGLGASKIMTEVEEKYEKQAITRMVPAIDGQTDTRISQTLPGGVRYVLLPQSYTDDWVLVRSTKTVHEIYENNVCVARMTTDHSDKGGAFLLANGYVVPADVEDVTIANYEKAYTALDTKSDRTNIEILPGSSSLTGDRQTLELEGRQKTYISGSDNSSVNSEEWYLDGDYLPSRYCPHYYSGNCRMSSLTIINPTFSGSKCPYGGLGWRPCERAVAALEKARSDEDDNKLMEPPVMCTAGSGDLWVSREIYLDTDDLSDDEALSIGTTIAHNILAAKAGARGATKIVTIPLDSSITPTGAIVSVTHDWKSMHSTLEIKQDLEIPSLLLPTTVSGASAIIAAREWRRQQQGYIGKVLSIDDDSIINVLVANRGVRCRTKLRYVAPNDTVLVALPAGSGSYGIIMERL